MIAAVPCTPDMLRSFRRAHNISQTRLGRLLGLNSNTIARYELGHTRPPAMLSLALAALDAGRRPPAVFETPDTKDYVNTVVLGDRELRQAEHLLNLSPVETRFLVGLYKAGCPLRSYELDALAPVSGYVANRLDPEHRKMATVRRFMFHLKQKIGPGMIGSKPNGGYWLTEKGKAFVRDALERAT